MKNLNIMVVDDDKKDRIILVEKLMSLKKYDCDVVQANCAKTAIDYFDKYDFDLVFLDFLLGDDDGLKFLTKLTKRQKKKTSIILITGSGNNIVKEDSIALGAKAYLNKKEVTIEDLDNVMNRS